MPSGMYECMHVCMGEDENVSIQSTPSIFIFLVAYAVRADKTASDGSGGSSSQSVA